MSPAPPPPRPAGRSNATVHHGYNQAQLPNEAASRSETAAAAHRRPRARFANPFPHSEPNHSRQISGHSGKAAPPSGIHIPLKFSIRNRSNQFTPTTQRDRSLSPSSPVQFGRLAFAGESHVSRTTLHSSWRSGLRFSIRRSSLRTHSSLRRVERRSKIDR